MTKKGSPSFTSNPNPNPTPAAAPSPQSQPTPRRRRTRGSSRRPRPQSITPVSSRPPIMGVPGQSTSSPNTGPRHPTPRPPPPSNVSFPGQNPFNGVPGAVPLPVGGSTGVNRTGGVLENPAAGKRAKEAGAAAGQSENNQQSDDAREKRLTCTACGKRCISTIAFYKHMRTHPENERNGAHSPPAVNAVEESADLPGGVQAPEEGAGADADAAEDRGDVADLPVTEEGGEAQGAGEGTSEPRKYRVPDLNYPAPEDDEE